MNDVDFLLLKAQVDALRTWAVIRDAQGLSLQYIWKSRYLLWLQERENLQELETTLPASLDSNRVYQRIYELQILLDVAYIRGDLQEFEIVRYIDAITLEKAKVVAPEDYDEETILRKVAPIL